MAEEKIMSEEMNKQQEAEVKAEAPAEIMQQSWKLLIRHLMKDILSFRRQMMQKGKSGQSLHR